MIQRDHNWDLVTLKDYLDLLLGRHGSDSLCRDEREKKMAATYNVSDAKQFFKVINH